MQTFKSGWMCVASLLVSLCGPAFATIDITSIKPNAKSPQPIGKVITYTVTATDSNAGPLAFQFSVTPPGGSSTVVYDFNLGTVSAGVWTSQKMPWSPAYCTGVPQTSGVVAFTCQQMEGAYTITVVAKDFVSGESATKTASFTINPLVTGSTPVVTATANPLVALFSAPACKVGSLMRVSFQEQSKATPATLTSWETCRENKTMNFEIAGMYAKTAYQMFSETKTGNKVTDGPTVDFTTGAIPTSVKLPPVTVNVGAGSQTDTADPILLVDPHQFGNGPVYPDFAMDLAGKTVWYYALNPEQNIIVSRPLQNGTILTIQSGPSWTPAPEPLQLLVQIDLAGNTIRQTNTGILQQQLLAMGDPDLGPCSSVPKPPPVGSACLDSLHHDAIQTLPNGDTAILSAVEKIFPPGTQGDTSGLPVDVIGDTIIVLNSNWQVIWYWDSFDPKGTGNGYPNLPVSRAATLSETCSINQAGCPTVQLLGSGVAPLAKDWLHCNSLYYWPKDQSGVVGQIILSSKDQDWVMKIDYQNGTGTGNILWRMGLDGDFTFNNTNNDPYPWFSSQHDVGMENNGAGPLSLFDNGDTRVQVLAKCKPNDCNSRGMALTVNESALTVTPVISDDLGVLAPSGGNAQLLEDGNYFFMAATVVVSISSEDSFFLEILPTAGTITGTQVLNVETTEGYRGWQLSSFYNPPIT